MVYLIHLKLEIYYLGLDFKTEKSDDKINKYFELKLATMFRDKGNLIPQSTLIKIQIYLVQLIQNI